MEESRVAPWILHLKYHTEEFFYEMLKRLQEVKEGKNLGDFASSSSYWLYDEENNKIIGASNLRHYLTENEDAILWGHIGYGIRPSERKKGYAAELLKLTLVEARNMGINKVYLGAYTGNIGSWKVMEKCNGIYENTITEKETGLPVKRYYIDIK